MTPHTLYVDLDDTFIYTDLLYESYTLLVKHKPLIALIALFYLLKGKNAFKGFIATHIRLNAETLPVNEDLLLFLRNNKSRWDRIVLATASHKKYATEVLNKFPDVFDDVLASDETRNLKSGRKLQEINNESTTFDYIGDSSADKVIFRNAESSFLVSKSLGKFSDLTFEKIFIRPQLTLKLILKQIRIHQWTKNLLLFVPLLTSGLFVSVDSIMTGIIGFFAFSFLASSTYIINDLLDLEADRQHPNKSKRPIACGTLSIPTAMLISSSLFVSSFILAVMTNAEFTLLLLAYFVLTLSYSLNFKQYVALDTILLASLYTIRIIGGAILIGVALSFWLLAFSMFIFFSLALVKRCAELKLLEKCDKQAATGRDYNSSDYTILSSFGSSSSMLAVLMFCFYLNSDVLEDQYTSPHVLWAAVPMLAYWLVRIWVKTSRGEMTDDPILFALKDRGSLIIVAGLAAVTIFGKLF
ncbi:UbiA family prenyltransferase [Glaciecola sp. MF2-115]|uniref:UbiA family prenyltransferase n=1 Tax=Glaciecola sp. MF2-115 TaxID=3384827 RepID=UPI00399FA874